MYAEQKWDSSLAKTRFAQSFPGLHQTDPLPELPIEAEVMLAEGVRLIRFRDQSFTLLPLHKHDIPKFLSSLRAAEPHLPSSYYPHFEMLRQLSAHDHEMGRLSRMEKLLGAVVNNTPQLPHLPEAVMQWLNDTPIHYPDSISESQRVQTDRILKALTDNLSEIPELRSELPKVLDGTSTLIQCDIMKARLNRS